MKLLKQTGLATLLHKENLKTLRLIIQGTFALFCLFSGYRFYQFYLWTLDRSEIYVPRPPAVEAFLPIGALINLKRFIFTGSYDKIHPAGLTIFIAALVIALLFRKGFCCWICPVGFASNLAEKFALKFKILRRLPVWIDYPLLAPKYMLLFFFGFFIVLKMRIPTIEAFNNSEFNLVADAKMLLFFLEPSPLTIWITTFLVITSFVLRNFWCRYLCPYGSLLGLLAMFSPVKIRRDPEVCIDCRRCEKVCPGSIQVAEGQTVYNLECIGCLECLAACPVEDCLSVTAGRRNIPAFWFPVAIVGLFLFFWGVAKLSGHWQSAVPVDLFKEYYQAVLSATGAAGVQ
ncbi:MAG: 4Fe-4S binding protein [Proteobacteria bacterium]|nr:4Fe-4S binding protein [Pseudomonadota bacterium]MBU1685727.1 4Fe-4S binding protein [Pseudomonadota bacterium]